MFNVGDDETCDGRLMSAAESAVTSGPDMSISETAAVSQTVSESTAEDAVKILTAKCQQLDAASNVTTPVMHKSASKYARL